MVKRKRLGNKLKGMLFIRNCDKEAPQFLEWDHSTISFLGETACGHTYFIMS